MARFYPVSHLADIQVCGTVQRSPHSSPQHRSNNPASWGGKARLLLACGRGGGFMFVITTTVHLFLHNMDSPTHSFIDELAARTTVKTYGDIK